MQKTLQRKDDNLISGRVSFRCMVICLYVGFATVGVFIYWYGFDVNALDQHTLASLEQLLGWGSCDSWPDFHP